MSDPRDEEMITALEVIDAALHDEPVDPELADLAELSLILRDERPRADPAFLTTLDRRAAARFAAAPAVSAPRRLRGLWWGAGTALAGVAAVVLVVVVGLRVGAGHPSSVHATSAGGGTATVSSSTSAVGSSGGRSAGPSGGSSVGRSGGSSTGSGVGRAASSGSASSPGPGPAAATDPGSPPAAGPAARVPRTAPVPHGAPGHDLTQSARIALRARRGGVSAVAEQVYGVVGAEHGFVRGSHVLSLAGGAGRATFTLAVPAARLRPTLTRLSSLRDATVTSRADSSTDITGDVNGAAQRLAAARALRRSLLTRLAAATTSGQADRLQAQLRADAASIVADSDALARLHARVADSTVAVSVTTAPAVGRRSRRADRAGGFTIARALHDAVRVLVVIAGVALIALAVLIPLTLLVALGLWARAGTARRRREGALGP